MSATSFLSALFISIPGKKLSTGCIMLKAIDAKLICFKIPEQTLALLQFNVQAKIGQCYPLVVEIRGIQQLISKFIA